MDGAVCTKGGQKKRKLRKSVQNGYLVVAYDAKTSRRASYEEEVISSTQHVGQLSQKHMIE